MRHSHSRLSSLASWGVCVFAGVASNLRSVWAGRSFDFRLKLGCCLFECTRDHATPGYSVSGLLFPSVLLPQTAGFPSRRCTRAHAHALPLYLREFWILDFGIQNGNGVTPSTRSMMILAGSFITESKRKLRGRPQVFHFPKLRFIFLFVSLCPFTHHISSMQRTPLVLLT